MFACPCCFNNLNSELECSCGFKGKFDGEIYHLHPENESWDDCLRQAKAHFAAVDWGLQKDQKIKMAGQVYSEEDAKRSIEIRNTLINTSMEIMGDVNNKLILDLGCADGSTISPLLVKKPRLVGLDINYRLLKNAKAFIPTLVLGSGYCLPFMEDYFDFVFESASLHHFIDRKLVLNNIKRVLKKGGIYISMANPPCDSSTAQIKEAKGRQKWYWDMFQLIEIQPTKEEYEQEFLEVFGNFGFWPVCKSNSIMRGIKNGK